jgi:phage baseplate assembly protein W
MLPHFAWPFTLGKDGTIATLEQDSRGEISQCVTVLLATPAGSRTEYPAYGVPDVTFTAGADIPAVQQAIGTFEPRAASARVRLDIRGDGHAQLRAELP